MSSSHSKNANANASTQEGFPGESFTGPTIKDKPLKTLDVRNLKTSSDLTALKAEDPFMYFSILAKAGIQGNALDLSDLSAMMIVQRSSRISYESIDANLDTLLTGVAAQGDADAAGIDANLDTLLTGVAAQGDADAAAGSGLGATVAHEVEEDDLFMSCFGTLADGSN